MWQFNFCPIVWYLWTVQNFRKIEKIQHKALHHVCDDFTASHAIQIASAMPRRNQCLTVTDSGARLWLCSYVHQSGNSSDVLWVVHSVGVLSLRCKLPDRHGTQGCSPLWTQSFGRTRLGRMALYGRIWVVTPAWRNGLAMLSVTLPT